MLSVPLVTAIVVMTIGYPATVETAEENKPVWLVMSLIEGDELVPLDDVNLDTDTVVTVEDWALVFGVGGGSCAALSGNSVK